MIINDNQQFDYKPLYVANKRAKILIIGQTPGAKTIQRGRLWDDKSGDTLRDWLNVSESLFYDEETFAHLPMDFYYPGKSKSGNDLPPRKGFAEKWHPLLLKEMPNIKLIILIGNYAQKYYLKDGYLSNLTNTVKNYKNYLPKYFPTPHPSPLNFRWQNNNPWFKDEALVVLKDLVQEILNN